MAISFVMLLGISYWAATGGEVMTAGRLSLRVIALGYLGLLLVVPIGMVFYRALEHGIGPAWDAVTTPPAQHAFYLTCVIALVAVPLQRRSSASPAPGCWPATSSAASDCWTRSSTSRSRSRPSSSASR